MDMLMGCRDLAPSLLGSPSGAAPPCGCPQRVYNGVADLVPRFRDTFFSYSLRTR